MPYDREPLPKPLWCSETVKVGAKKIVEECHPAQGAPVPQRQEPLFLTAYVLFFQ